MIELSFVPSACKSTEDKPATMKGEVKVLAPPYPKRLKYQARFAGLATGDADAPAKTEAEKRSDQMLVIAELVEESTQYIKSVDLELADGSVKCKSVDELLGLQEFEGVMIEIAMAMIQGFAGNSRRP